MQLKCFLVAFDFDYTVIEDNSDTVVRSLLTEIPQSIEDQRETRGWTFYMNEIFRLLHENKIAESDIIKAVVSIPPTPNTIEMLNTLKEMDCEVIIISDANTVFIDEWLKAHGVSSCVHKIFSNPGKFEEGRLTIKGYVGFARFKVNSNINRIVDPRRR